MKSASGSQAGGFSGEGCFEVEVTASFAATRHRMLHRERFKGVIQFLEIARIFCDPLGAEPCFV